MNATALSRNTRIPATPRNSALERHGIFHLSPSSLNQWINCPSLFVMERLVNRRGPMGCAAHRGTAAEAGISLGLFEGASASDCAIHALAKYDELTARSSDPKRDQERGVVPGMVAQGLSALKGLGVPTKPETGNQHKVELRLPDVSVPVIGYLDFVWATHGLIVDTKSTLRVPSSLSATHKRQGSLYQHGSPNAEVRFVYFSDKKWSPLTLTREEYEDGMRELTHAAIRLERFLSLSDDAQELASIITPDFDAFYWNDPETRALGRQTYGF